MFDVVKKLMMARQLRMEEGRLNMLNQNIIMMPINTLVTIQKILETEGKENLIYEAAKESGSNWFKQMRKDFNIRLDDIAKWGLDIISLAGYGKPTITNLDRKTNRMIVHMENSTTADAYGNVNKCVDHVMRGYLAGAGILYFGVDAECVETKCKSKGDHVCEFIVKTKQEFDFNNELVKKQLSRIEWQ